MDHEKMFRVIVISGMGLTLPALGLACGQIADAGTQSDQFPDEGAQDAGSFPHEGRDAHTPERFPDEGPGDAGIPRFPDEGPADAGSPHFPTEGLDVGVIDDPDAAPSEEAGDAGVAPGTGDGGDQ